MALLYKVNNPLHGVWKMEESSDQLLEKLDRKSDFESFMNRVSAEKRRQEHLASRVLLKTLCGEEMKVEYRSTGAPFLSDKPLFISISHTKDYVAVILDDQPTGIDIEYRSNRVVKIRSRFMNPEEEAGVDPEHVVEHLLIHWCAKETLFKIIDQQEVDFQRHLHVVPFSYADEGVFTVRETRTSACRDFQLAYKVTPEYVMTWAIKNMRR